MATQAEIGKHLDIGERYVRKLIEAGVLPPSRGKGGLDIDDCRIAYVRYLRGLSTGQTRPVMSGDSDSRTGAGKAQFQPDEHTAQKLEQEKLRLTIAQADAVELKNDVARRKLIPAEFVTFAFGKFIPAAASIFDTMVMTLRRRHPDLTAAHLDTIERELTKARNTISQSADLLHEWHEEFLDANSAD